MLPDSIIQLGDALLYFDSASPMDWAIAVKTFTKVSHIEIYVGYGKSIAARPGVGCGKYPLRRDGLVAIRRPIKPFDLNAAMAWFTRSRGVHPAPCREDYDWKGLLCFTLAVKQGSPDKMFCSELALRFYRHGKFEPFAPELDADTTPPSYFDITGACKTIWRKKAMSDRPGHAGAPLKNVCTH